jgi:putative transposase
MSKKKLGSKNREKFKIKVGKIHFRIKKIRENFQHQFSNDILKNFDVITMETLSIQNLMKNARLSKSIQNQSWYSIKNNIKTKFFPSSKICSCCGTIKSTLDLSEREWSCSNCNILHDRDINAARNLNLISIWYKSTGTTITTKSEFETKITPYLKK